MKNAIHEIAKIKVFLIACFLFIVVGGIIALMYDKTTIHLSINEHHNYWFDAIFKHGTDLGDGLITALAIVPIGLMLFKKYRFSTFILGGLTMLFTGIFAQFMKRVVYPNAERPMRFIGEEFLYLVPGVDVHSMNSFPSGHTATAFAFFAFITFAFFRTKKRYQLMMALLAVFVGYSRMYLSQHFLEDVVVGALLGLLAYFVAHIIVGMIPWKKGIV